MRSESSFFGAMFEEGELEAYLGRMALNRTWGDELTLRATADCYRVSIHVVTSTVENWYLAYEPQGGAAARRNLFLTYISPVHYDALTASAPAQPTDAAPTPARATGGYAPGSVPA